MTRPWPLIKVCGIRSLADAETALQNGANTIGLLVGLTHKADDKIDEQTAATIAAHVKSTYPAARIVLVTHLLDGDAVIRLAEYIGVTAIQIHDDMTVEHIHRLRAALPACELIKAIHIEGAGQDALAKAKLYAPCVDVLLTDSKSTDPDGQIRIGGTGKRHDPEIVRALVESFPEMPVVLAGGLNPDNIEDAIRQIGPAGIDANSGLETPEGFKDAGKVARFAKAGAKIPVKA